MAASTYQLAISGLLMPFLHSVDSSLCTNSGVDSEAGWKLPRLFSLFEEEDSDIGEGSRGILNEAEYGEEYGKYGQGVIAVKGNGGVWGWRVTRWREKTAGISEVPDGAAVGKIKLLAKRKLFFLC